TVQRSHTTVFETVPFNHSGTSPRSGAPAPSLRLAVRLRCHLRSDRSPQRAMTTRGASIPRTDGTCSTVATSVDSTSALFVDWSMPDVVAHRLMAGQRILVPLVGVRVPVGQPNFSPWR